MVEEIKQALEWLQNQEKILENNNEEEIETIDFNDIEITLKQKKLVSVRNFNIGDILYMELLYSDNTKKIFEDTLPESAQMTFEILSKDPNQNMTLIFDTLTKNLKEVNLNELEELSSVSKNNSNQKRLGTHPGVGNFLHSFMDKEGFMNLLFFIFLTGISSGIIIVIVLNLLSR
mgnify:CR=1 FL=1